MSVRIVTLTENIANPGMLAEWGLSVLIDVDGTKVLLDTGQGISAAYNADTLGISISGLDKLVLSHGHYDHTGGLKDILTRTGSVDIIAHPDMWDAKYAVYGDFQRYIGVPFQRAELESMAAQFRLNREPVWITENMVTTGEIPMTNDYETIDAGMFVKEGDSFRPDELLDDLALGIKTEAGLVVILGCGHRGIINTIRHLKNVTGASEVFCVIGGTHLITAPEERLVWTVEELKEIGVKKLGVSHCTGFKASCWLANEFPEEFFMNNSGTTLNLP